MAWYTASLLFKSTHIDRSQIEPLWEERIILIQAANESEARQKASTIGNEDQHEYTVLDGAPGEPAGRLKWTFEQIDTVCELECETLADGKQLFWRFLRDSEVKSMLTPFDDE